MERTLLNKSTLAAFASRLSSVDLNDSQLPPFTPNRIKIEVLSGLTVALALVPEAVAFSFVAFTSARATLP